MLCFTWNGVCCSSFVRHVLCSLPLGSVVCMFRLGGLCMCTSRCFGIVRRFVFVAICGGICLAFSLPDMRGPQAPSRPRGASWRPCGRCCTGSLVVYVQHDTGPRVGSLCLFCCVTPSLSPAAVPAEFPPLGFRVLPPLASCLGC